MINFKNTYVTLPARFYQEVMPATFDDPQLLLFNSNLAKELEIETSDVSENDLALIFSGQKILPGSRPIAQAYAGFQFGQPVPQLGDGRAHLLGEVNGFDLQLKGSGQTQFSRNGDGRSALGPVIREYIVSEAMHALGVPTTRALCAVSTGEEVFRQDGPDPGGIFTRVATSHLRVGTFQYFAMRDDREGLEILLDYTIKRHYPELAALPSLQEKCLELLKSLTYKQADLIAQWSSYGFIHGVMNTDNFSLAGITIDYGPCAFLDEFQFNKVFSSIDHYGRYSFFNQVPIAKWNILRLADCLLPLIHSNQDRAISLVENELKELFKIFEFKRMKSFAHKLGIQDYQNEDERFVMQFLKYMESHHLDFTNTFRALPELYSNEFNQFERTIELEQWLSNWKSRVSDIDRLNKINPLYIPRNHQVQKAIDLAYQGDFTYFKQMVEILKNPFTPNTLIEKFEKAPQKDERVYQTFCGT